MLKLEGKSRIWTIVITVLATLLVVFVATIFHKPEKELDRKVEHLHGVHDPQFKREMSALMGPTILPGNSITALRNGDEIFPAMLKAIHDAKRSITFETYIYWSGSIGKQFADALSERARAGVKVHIILDWAGSSKLANLLDELKSAGVEIQRYHPLHWYSLGRLNHRTHRKLLVVDGKLGFTGGVGIADSWLGHAQDPDHWRDMHFRVEGPVVAQMQSAFMDNWIKTSGTVLHGDTYFPVLGSAGGMDMHMFISSPAGGSASMHLMFLLAIAGAEHTIDIEAAYFLPDSLMTKALIAARKRGVKVRVILPDKHLDSETVRLSAKGGWGPLLAQGVEIHEYEPTMLHCKVMIIDGEMVSVGSTNFDLRSFQLNDEASLNVYNREFAAQMTKVFEDDLAQTTAYSYQLWLDRSWAQKLSEIVLLPIKSQL